jgi:fumarylacetoacetase
MISWLDVPENSDFSLANIPYGVATFVGDPNSLPFCVTAIGDNVINLGVLQDAGAFDSIDNLLPDTFEQPTLNKFLEHPPNVWPRVRARLVELLEKNKDDFLKENPDLQKACIHDRSKLVMHLPIKIGEYTDFYSSREHATNVGVSKFPLSI